MTHYDDKDDAIKAAITEVEWGSDVVIHEEHCWMGTKVQICTCTPRKWKNS